MIEMIGQKFGKLTVIKRSENNTNAGKPKYLCQCECGGTTTVDGRDLRRGRTQSCGCNKEKYGSKLLEKKLYAVWSYMRTRVNNLNCKDYPNYGGRGIKICLEWENDFLVFQSWALHNGYRPDSNLTLDRKDNDGNYEPDNCRWVTMLEQARNKRNNVWLEYDGITLTATEWARKLSVNPSTIHYHIGKEDVFEWLEMRTKKEEKSLVPASNFSFAMEIAI